MEEQLEEFREKETSTRKMYDTILSALHDQANVIYFSESFLE